MSDNCVLPSDTGLTPQMAYYAQSRTEMLSFIPANARTLLDVGCGAGHFGAAAKAERAITVWGVDTNPGVIELAKERLDRVLVGEFTGEVGLAEQRFDCIVFNDVLEHMVDPWQALVLARRHLSRDGVVVASLPNLRHFSILWELLIRGEWRYERSGILDISHLRFFTKKSLVRLFVDSGYDVERLEGINPHRQGRKFHVLNTLFRSSVNEMQYLQFAVVARPLVSPEVVE